MPGRGDRQAVAAEIRRAHLAERPEIFWLSDGIEDGQGKALRDALRKLGICSVSLRPISRRMACCRHAATPPASPSPRSAPMPPIRRSIQVTAIGSRGETLSDATLAFKAGQDRGGAHITAAAGSAQRDRAASDSQMKTARAPCSCWIPAASSGAWASSRRRRPRTNSRCCPTSIIWSARWRPSPKWTRAPSASLIAQHISVLMLADIGRISGSDADAVAKFVSHGGVLIRFAGARMTAAPTILVPVSCAAAGAISAARWPGPARSIWRRFPLRSPVQRPGRTR